MPFSCVILTPGVATNNGDGTWAEGAPVETEVPCGVMEPGGREVIVGGAVVSQGEAVIRLPFGTNVPANATIVRQAIEGRPEKTYQVKRPLDGKSFPTALEVLVTEG